MKEIVIISGKGGTGKTSITSSLTMLGGNDLIAADCDVDAPDMHLLLQPDHAESHDFYSGELAVLDNDKCSSCGICMQVCRFEAISIINDNYTVNKINCEGCGYCSYVCPDKAIEMVVQNVGKWYISNIKSGSKMVHAQLKVGAENSGKLVAQVKNEARKIARENDIKYVLVDGSPGIGCPVISSLTGADFAVIVTEPTASGIHDLKRVKDLVKRFKIKCSGIINKCDINPPICKEIEEYFKEEGIYHLASISYDENFTKSMTVGETIVEYDKGELKNKIEDIWENITDLLETNGEKQ
jgi:MinD superfamily P-loop ATPase